MAAGLSSLRGGLTLSNSRKVLSFQVCRHPCRMRKFHVQDRHVEKESYGSMLLYLNEISKIPLLSPQEEKHLAWCVQGGNQEALQSLVRSNLRFVIKIAKRYQKSGIPLMDLIHEGNLGLIEAAKRFDPGRNVRFATYAVWWIRQAILHSLLQMSRPFRVSSKTANILGRVATALANTKAERETLSREALAHEIGVNLRDLNSALEASGPYLSLEMTIDEASEVLLSDTIQQTAIPSPETVAIMERLRAHLNKSIGKLDPREQRVIILRFGLNGMPSMTLSTIGKRMGLSRERIRQIEARALKRLRWFSNASTLVSYLN